MLECKSSLCHAGLRYIELIILLSVLVLQRAKKVRQDPVVAPVLLRLNLSVLGVMSNDVCSSDLCCHISVLFVVSCLNLN